jgi:hypothetical protein
MKPLSATPAICASTPRASPAPGQASAAVMSFRLGRRPDPFHALQRGPASLSPVTPPRGDARPPGARRDLALDMSRAAIQREAPPRLVGRTDSAWEPNRCLAPGTIPISAPRPPMGAAPRPRDLPAFHPGVGHGPGRPPRTADPSTCRYNRIHINELWRRTTLRIAPELPRSRNRGPGAHPVTRLLDAGHRGRRLGGTQEASPVPTQRQPGDRGCTLHRDSVHGGGDGDATRIDWA